MSHTNYVTSVIVEGFSHWGEVQGSMYMRMVMHHYLIDESNIIELGENACIYEGIEAHVIIVSRDAIKFQTLSWAAPISVHFGSLFNHHNYRQSGNKKIGIKFLSVKVVLISYTRS